MSAATRVELGIVTESRFGPPGVDLVDRLLRDAAIVIVDVDADIAARALSAWRRFGRGRHKAALTFGDCFGYALAERSAYAVLCTGDGFAVTDLPVTRPTS